MRADVYSETRRQIVHVTMSAFALLLPYLTWPQAAGMALAALLFNAFALRSVAPQIIRQGEGRSGRAGVLYYPASVLLLILFFRERLDLVAAAWGVMAFGDGFATIAGTTLRRPRLSWNPDKTWSGLVAFVVAGAMGAVALALWVAPSIEPAPARAALVAASIAAAIVAALVETIPINLDDNLSVPFSAAAILWISTRIDLVPVDAWGTIATGAALSAPIAVLAVMARAVSITGGFAGFLCAIAVYAGAGGAGLLVLGTALVLTVVTSRAGKRRKEQLGIAEDAGGRRGAGNVLANCLAGAAGGLLAFTAADAAAQLTGLMLCVTGIAAGASDTVASEIGKAFGGRPRAFPTFRAAAPGTAGAVSISGTLAGMAAAAIIAWPMAALISYERLPIVVAACTAGAFIESALATYLETPGILDNHTLNFLNTAAAAGIAAWAV